MKKLLYLVLGIVAIFVIAAISFFLLFDPNDFRENISAEVERVTGRELVIEGDLALSYFPWLAIDVGKTRLGNAAGFGDEPFASFERARLSVRLLPMLLRREIAIGTASLDSLQLNLAIARDGRSNWEDLLDGSEAAEETPETGDTDGRALDIAGIEIVNSAVSYSDAQSGESYRLADFNLTSGRIARGQMVSLQSDFDFEIQPMDLAGDFSIETTVGLPAEGTMLLFTDADISVLGLDVSVAFDDDNPSPLVQVDAFSLKSLMQRLNIEPLETADPDALGKIIFEARANYGETGLALEDVELVVDDTTFAGSLSFGDSNGVTGINLAGDSIDLNRYMAPAAEAAGGGQEVAPVEIPAELIRSLNARGSMTLDEALLAGMTFENVELGVNSRSGNLRMHPIKAAFFDGSYEGDVRIDASGATPVLSVNENVRNVNVGSLAKSMFDKDDITGTINGSFQLSGRGADVGVIQRNLSGNISFELLDGAWEGTDLWYELRRARALLKEEEPPEPQLPPRTQFSSVKLTGPVTDGVFRNDDLLAELPFMQLTGKGEVDLPTTEIDYRMSARVLERPEFVQDATEEELDEFTEAVIPLRITGTLAAPSIKPDIEKMLKKEVKKEIKKRLLDELLGGDEEPAEEAAEEGAEEEQDAGDGKKKKKKDRDKLKDALEDLLKG